jgi:hypothetical protein
MQAANICAQLSLDVAWADAVFWHCALSLFCWAWLWFRSGTTVSAWGGGGGAGGCCGSQPVAAMRAQAANATTGETERHTLRMANLRICRA